MYHLLTLQCGSLFNHTDWLFNHTEETRRGNQIPSRTKNPFGCEKVRKKVKPGHFPRLCETHSIVTKQTRTGKNMIDYNPINQCEIIVKPYPWFTGKIQIGLEPNLFKYHHVQYKVVHSAKNSTNCPNLKQQSRYQFNGIYSLEYMAN